MAGLDKLDQFASRFQNSKLERTAIGLADLPEELQLAIYKLLPDKGLARLSRCSKHHAALSAVTRKDRKMIMKWSILDLEGLPARGGRGYMLPMHAIEALEHDPRIAQYVRTFIYTPQTRVEWGGGDEESFVRYRRETMAPIQTQLARLVSAGVVTLREKNGMQSDMLDVDGWMWIILLSMLPKLETLVICPTYKMSTWAIEKVVQYVRSTGTTGQNAGGAVQFGSPTRLELRVRPGNGHLHSDFEQWMRPSSTVNYEQDCVQASSPLLLLPSIVEVEGYGLSHGRRYDDYDYFQWPEWSGRREEGEFSNDDNDDDHEDSGNEDDQIVMDSNVKRVKWTNCYVTPRDVAEMLKGAPDLKTIEISGYNPRTAVQFRYRERDLDNIFQSVVFSRPSLYKAYLAHSYKVKTGGRQGLALPEDLDVVVPGWKPSKPDHDFIFG